MKKILVLILSICLSLALFSACGSKTPSSGSDMPSLTKPSSTKQSTQKPSDNSSGNQTTLPGGATVTDGWDPETFIGLTKPEGFTFHTTLNMDADTDVIGYQASDETVSAYLDVLKQEGYEISEDETVDGDMEYRADKDGSQVRLVHKKGSGGMLYYYPYVIDNSDWPKDYVPSLPIPNVNIDMVDGNDTDGWYISTDYWSAEDAMAYIEECKAAGFTEEMFESYSDTSKAFEAQNKDGYKLLIDWNTENTGEPYADITLTKIS